MVRPVSPIVQDCLNIWVATMSTSRKVRQLRQNPRVSLAFVHQPGGDKAATVIGEAEEITDPVEKKRIWHMARYDMSEYFPDGPGSDLYTLLKINVEKIEWRDRWEGGLKVYEPPEA
jgi:general stress protein 26